jgi:hypothetical protein
MSVEMISVNLCAKHGQTSNEQFLACFIYSFLGNTTYGISVDGDRHPYLDLA